MNQLTRLWVWLSRMHHSLGFGIQSPTDYVFVREVVNEHAPYYAYQQLNKQSGDWLKRKLGRLYLRLVNWRQPTAMLRDAYEPFWRAGCRKVRFAAVLDHYELVRVDMSDQTEDALAHIYNKVDDRSVLIVENLSGNWDLWHRIEKDGRTGVTFDLYYCGIVFFDKKRHKMNYKVNF